MVMYDNESETMGEKIQTKDKTEPVPQLKF